MFKLGYRELNLLDGSQRLNPRELVYLAPRRRFFNFVSYFYFESCKKVDDRKAYRWQVNLHMPLSLGGFLNDRLLFKEFQSCNVLVTCPRINLYYLQVLV